MMQERGSSLDNPGEVVLAGTEIKFRSGVDPPTPP